MAKGFIIENQIAATNVDSYNRYAVCSDTDFDGGNLVSLSAPTAVGDNVWTADTPATGSLTGLWICYNPSFHITKVGDNEFAGLTQDPRDYTNVKGKTFTVFKPQIGDIFTVSSDCVDSSYSSVTAGDFIEAKNAQATWTRKTSSPTSSVTAAKVNVVKNIPFPATKGHVGFSKQKAFEVEVVQL